MATRTLKLSIDVELDFDTKDDPRGEWFELGKEDLDIIARRLESVVNGRINAPAVERIRTTIKQTARVRKSKRRSRGRSSR